MPVSNPFPGGRFAASAARCRAARRRLRWPRAPTRVHLRLQPGLSRPVPHFEDFYADKLRGSLGVTDAESVLDLRGANRPTAEASLADMLEAAASGRARRWRSASTRRPRAAARPCSSRRAACSSRPSARAWWIVSRPCPPATDWDLRGPIRQGCAFHRRITTRDLGDRLLNLGHNTIERLARFGYGARGIVYCIIGGLALLAAIGQGGRAGDSESASAGSWPVRSEPSRRPDRARSPGLRRLAAHRERQDADRRGTAPKGVVVHLAHLLSAGSIPASPSPPAVTPWASGAAGRRRAQDWTAWLLAKPFGLWLVGLIGRGVMGGGGASWSRRSRAMSPTA